MKIAIIGAGPRGLMTLERLVARHNRDHFPLSVTLYDPAGIGGMVWQPEQPLALIMNTIPIQITLYYQFLVTTKMFMQQDKLGLQCLQQIKAPGPSSFNGSAVFNLF